ncbi:MAG: hypothetical protein H0V07_06250 [Propionibacteriales bacterium]|nr:hypothetical protein [Propionibacteriales bacterium]
MSSTLEDLYVSTPNGAPGQKAADALSPWLDRRKQGRDHRRKFEDTWRLCQHFLDGQQWTAINRTSREIVDLRTRQEERNREHYTIDMLSQYVRAAVGRMFAGDFRPTLAFRRDDWETQAVARQAQRAFDFAWDEELGADEVIYELILGMASYGTEALWCRFDPTKGKLLGEVPVADGKPLLDPQAAHEHVAGLAFTGQRAQFKQVREGKLVWEDLGWGNIIPPPGVRREQNFPWLILERPVPVAALKAQYGSKADAISEEPLGTLDTGNNEDKKLKGHGILSTGLEWPTAEHPNGREVVWASGQVLEIRDSLPYMIKGEPKAGVFFFHWQRLKHRFWSQGVGEKLIGSQRNLNRRRSQVSESIDRMGLGRVYTRPGAMTVKNVPQGKIGEVIEVKPQYDWPQETTGTGPGPWLQADAEISKNDMDRVSGMSDTTFGQAPQGVSAYSAMALLKEEMDRNLGPALMLTRQRIAEASEVTLEAMRLYWPPNKELIIAGEDHIVDAVTFNAAQLPLCYYIEKPKGAPAPNSPAAEIQKIFDLYDRSIQGGHPLPLTWLYDSLAASKALPLPKQEIDVQRGKAEMENHLLIRGVPVQPAEYDNDQMHIQIHRAAEAAYALLPNSEQVVAGIEAHIKAHVSNAQLKQGQAMLGGGAPQLQGPQGQLAQAPPQNPLAPPIAGPGQSAPV